MSHYGNCYQKRKKGFHQDDEIKIDFEKRGVLITMIDHRNRQFNEFHIPIEEFLEALSPVRHYTNKIGIEWEII